MIQFDEHIFQMGWFNHQLVYIYIYTHTIFLDKKIRFVWFNLIFIFAPCILYWELCLHVDSEIFSTLAGQYTPRPNMPRPPRNRGFSSRPCQGKPIFNKPLRRPYFGGYQFQGISPDFFSEGKISFFPSPLLCSLQGYQQKYCTCWW